MRSSDATVPFDAPRRAWSTRFERGPGRAVRALDQQDAHPLARCAHGVGLEARPRDAVGQQLEALLPAGAGPLGAQPERVAAGDGGHGRPVGGQRARDLVAATLAAGAGPRRGQDLLDAAQVVRLAALAAAPQRPRRHQRCRAVAHDDHPHAVGQLATHDVRPGLRRGRGDQHGRQQGKECAAHPSGREYTPSTPVVNREAMGGGDRAGSGAAVAPSRAPLCCACEVSDDNDNVHVCCPFPIPHPHPHPHPIPDLPLLDFFLARPRTPYRLLPPAPSSSRLPQLPRPSRPQYLADAALGLFAQTGATPDEALERRRLR